MAAQFALGIDVGGTKIYAGVVNVETGEVIKTARKRTHPERGVDFFVKRLCDVAAEALDAAELPADAAAGGIGIGLAAQVDRDRGVILGAPNLAQGLINYNIVDVLHERFKLPVTLGNDVEIATYGEQYYGAAKGCQDFVCVFVGTGVGAAIVEESNVRRGATGTAGEIGHTVVQLGGRLCGCGGRGHLEAYASRTAITRVLLAELRRGRRSKLTELIKPEDTEIRSKVIAKCEDEGDPLVMETLTEAADYLGAGLGSLASFFNPARIVLGGGLVEASRFFFERSVERAHEITLPAATRALEIVRTKLGDDSGIVGAAWMAAKGTQNAVTKA
jgi:glucokinase